MKKKKHFSLIIIRRKRPMNAKLLVKLYGLVVPFKSILGSSIENNIYFVELHLFFSIIP